MLDKTEKLLRTVFARPEYWFHIRELARAVGYHPNTVITITNQLVKRGFLLKRKHKHLIEVSAHRDSVVYKRKKQLLNIELLQEVGVIDYLIDFYNHPSAIVLFGSFARGEDWSESDIDLAVITPEKKTSDLSRFEKILAKKIHLLSLHYPDISPELYNNLINGIVLYGYFEDERISKLSREQKSK